MAGSGIIWRKNAGTCPAIAYGKRVVVKLRNGTIHGEKPVNPTSPAGWAADGRGGCRWSLEGHWSDIVEYRVLGA